MLSSDKQVDLEMEKAENLCSIIFMLNIITIAEDFLAVFIIIFQKVLYRTMYTTFSSNLKNNIIMQNHLIMQMVL